MKIDTRLLIAACVIGAIAGITRGITTPRTVHTYEAYNYNGDITVIHATKAYPVGVTIQFTLPDGNKLWLIDVAEVRQVK